VADLCQVLPPFMRQSVPSQVRELPRAAEAGSPPTGLLVLGCPPAASEDLTPRRHPTCVRGMNKGMVTPGTFRFLIIGNLFKASGAPRLRQKPCLPPALTAVCPLSPVYTCSGLWWPSECCWPFPQWARMQQSHASLPSAAIWGLYLGALC
jgi:hypothetical protein